MAFVFDIVYKDYNPDKPVSRVKHFVPTSVVAADNGTGYTTAQGVMADVLAALQSISLSNVYAEGLRWQSPTAYVASNNISANNNNRLVIDFSLQGKKQTGRYTIPAPDETQVRGLDRRVDNAIVSNLPIVTDAFDAGYLSLSDGDVPTVVRDADLISVKGKYQE